MTAKRAGETVARGFWVTLKRLRDRWVLLAFLATAAFWARDIYDEYVILPAQFAELRVKVDGLRSEVALLELGEVEVLIDRSPALTFPGMAHNVEDGSPGLPITVRFRPAERVREECHSGGLAAYMIDAGGRWYSVETDLARLPQFVGAQELAFGVQVHPRMALGRAQFMVQVVQNCGTHLQVDSSPRLHFRVLAPESL